MIALVWLIAAADAPVDEVPLVAPIVDEIVEEHAPPPRADDRRIFHVGVSVLGFVQSGPQRGGPLGRLEVGVRFPFAGARIGVMLLPNVAGAFGDGRAVIVGVPLAASYHEAIGPGHLRVYAGPSLDWASAAATAGAQAFVDRALSFGMMAGVSYLLDVPGGKLVFDVGYRLLSYLSGGAAQRAHGGFAGVGYAFWL